MYKYPEDEEFRRLMFLQISDKEDVFLERSEDEFSFLSDIFHKNELANIADLGCGIGRSSIYFKNKLNLDNTHFFMMDYTGEDFEKSRSCGFHDKGEVVAYNNLDITEKFCQLNNLSNFTICNLGENIEIDSKCDLLYSFHSVGYHFSIKEALDKINYDKLLKEGSYVILGLSFKFENKIKNNQINLPRLELQEIRKGGMMQNYAIYKFL